ncbi:MAG TPA: peptidylprolyl isomerase [Cyclobacteriaceae bacterium]|jgi:cyclophilin family peptidyl-prolyl cis-trans isomerase|nr:peptidylprolyl isomerase [Cyclobacteriaceae bacterium]
MKYFLTTSFFLRAFVSSLRKASLLLFLCIALSCTQKQNIKITQQNVVEVLTQYGKENPETEVIIETKMGTMRLKLYEDTPLHRANFVKLIKEGHYDEADFYRIVAEFMIQGGDLSNMPTYTIPAEFSPNHFHKKGALSMARQDENNPGMESSAAEFFIIHGGPYRPEDVDDEARQLGITVTPEQKEAYVKQGGYMALDQKYTVFGEVTEGFDVIDKIASQPIYEVDKPMTKIPFKISVVEAKK